MTRSALILSCAIHGSVLALVGWSSLLVAPRLDSRKAEVSVSLSPGEEENVLFIDDFQTPWMQPPQIVPPSAETSFSPPVPTFKPPPMPVATMEAAASPISTTADMPQKMPSIAPAKKERAPRTASASARRGASSGAVAGLSAGGGGGSGYVPPQYLLRYKPPYPEQARAQRLEGVVLLFVGVDAAGRVTSASIRQGCGHAMLDRAALEAVRSWKFTPARQGDRAIPATVEVPIRFNFSA
ncbi:MAG: TonB family protein [Chthoniobacter sp.]|uniref:energy transducer TonB n=1 Tax=Chthoniobacter sp. TaxID=2510640 RepID=UPI0032A9E48E